MCTLYFCCLFPPPLSSSPLSSRSSSSSSQESAAQDFGSARQLWTTAIEFLGRSIRFSWNQADIWSCWYPIGAFKDQICRWSFLNPVLLPWACKLEYHTFGISCVEWASPSLNNVTLQALSASEEISSLMISCSCEPFCCNIYITEQELGCSSSSCWVPFPAGRRLITALFMSARQDLTWTQAEAFFSILFYFLWFLSRSRSCSSWSAPSSTSTLKPLFDDAITGSQAEFNI